MSDIFNMFNDLGKKVSQYTPDEIEKARRKAKKTGRSFMDVLQEDSGKSFSSSPSVSMNQILSDMTGRQQEAENAADSMTQMLQDLAKQNQETLQALNSSDALCDTTQKDLEELRKNIAKDFGLSPSDDSGASVITQNSVTAAVTQGKPVDSNTSAVEKSADIESFNGVDEAVSEHVFGQETLIRKLIVAFKRPWILPNEEHHAKNCFYLHGPENTGKRYALNKVASELADRGLLASGEVYEMDLSRYSGAGKDNVFLQDLYMALKSQSSVILFENFEECHISYLSYINDLVTKGECYLQDRYMEQKGQLINVNNAFAKETISTFTPEGKYLAFVSTKSVENLANVFGAPFINALGDICPSQKLDNDSLRKIAKVQWDALLKKVSSQLSFDLQAEEDVILDAAVAATAKNAGIQGLTEFFDKLLKALATLKLEGSYESNTKVVLSIQEGTLFAEIGEEKMNLLGNLPETYTGNVASVKAELDKIVGLSEIKKYILSLEEYYNTQKRRTEAGLKASDVSKHMIFTGNPGTGKTTIARIISRYLKAIGILSGGQLVEVSRADLVGRFVGHTAPLVNQVIKSALGGVLFIDEAYSLYRGKDDAFGLEAIDTLVKGIEDNRDNLIVILAGYSNEMNEFLEANSGLKSRFPNIIDFPDYTGEELLEITKITVTSKGYVLDELAEGPLLAYYTRVQLTNPDTAGNGRLVRNKVEEAILNQSRRLVAEPEADLSLLLAEDFVLEDN